MKLAPLTILQRLLWDAIQKEGRDDLPKAVQSVRLRGNLNLEVLRRSLDAIVCRHDSLSTRIDVFAGEPTQVISRPQAFRLKVLQCGGISEEEINAEIDGFAARFRQRRMHIQIGPLFRVRLLRFSEDDHALVLVMHHIMVDGASFALFFRDLWTFYGEFFCGQEISTSKRPMQYWEYANWQNGRRATCLQKGDKYWNKRFAESTSAYITRSKPAALLSSVASVKISFGELLTMRLNELSRRSKVARALVVLAVYTYVLSIWYQKRDFPVVNVISGRSLAPHANVMGWFACPVPLRMELEECKTFGELLATVALEYRTACRHLEGYEHCVLGVSNPHLEDMTRTAAVFNWFVTSDADLKGEARSTGLAVEPIPMKIRLGKAMCEVALLLTTTTKDICGDIIYRPDIVGSSAISVLSNDLTVVAECVVCDPEVSLAALTSHLSNARRVATG